VIASVAFHSTRQAMASSPVLECSSVLGSEAEKEEEGGIRGEARDEEEEKKKINVTGKR
jgi:hypothetical protein